MSYCSNWLVFVSSLLLIFRSNFVVLLRVPTPYGVYGISLFCIPIFVSDCILVYTKYILLSLSHALLDYELRNSNLTTLLFISLLSYKPIIPVDAIQVFKSFCLPQTQPGQIVNFQHSEAIHTTWIKVFVCPRPSQGRLLIFSTWKRSTLLG